MLKAMFTPSVKNFLRQAFLVSLMYAVKFLLYVESFLRSKFCLKKNNDTLGV